MSSEAMQKYHFETGVYRPPSEGGSYSLLVRFTRNCPWNRCTFCGMYKTEKFELRSPAEIKKDIDAMAAICNDLKTAAQKLGYGAADMRGAAAALLNKVPELNYHQGFVMVFNWLLSGGKTAFLQDANSLIMKTDQLVDVLKYLRKTFPSISRVTSYARSKTLAQKKPAQLTAVRRAGLDRLHVGLETGDDDLLKKIKKGATALGHISAGRKALQAGFELSEYWMPGLGGKEMSQKHAKNTARVLNEINPHYIRSRPFFPLPGTPLYDAMGKNEFQMLSAEEQLLELQWMMEELEVTSKVCFDHAGNYWRNRHGDLLFTHSYEGYKFPEEKATVLDLIAQGLEARNKRPEFLKL
ncbi:MAG: radical SAM protein [Desulfobacterales bacterium]|jgi:radical SAM superfamily enzyme YgiQ (UPF0313 family)